MPAISPRPGPACCGMLKDIGLARSDIDYVAQALADGYDDPTRSRSLRAN